MIDFSTTEWTEMTEESIKEALQELRLKQLQEIEKFKGDRVIFHDLVSQISESTNGVYEPNGVIFTSQQKARLHPKNRKRKLARRKSRRKIQKESRRHNR